jgi:hypothetical protein
MIANLTYIDRTPLSGKMCSIQHYVIKFISDLRQVRGFLRVLQFLFTNKTDCHHIAEILLKVALITITLLELLSIRNTNAGPKEVEFRQISL